MYSKIELLSKIFGYTSFREGQEPLIDSLNNNVDTLGILPTGAGKSICFQIPALIKKGITLVVSPLISLMSDQVLALKQNGIAGAYINSSLNPLQIKKALQNAMDGMYKIIYIAPERLLLPDFIYFAKNSNIAMLIIDEAHCISQWGHDFRPSYLDIIKFIDQIGYRPVIGAFTATATKKVLIDIKEQLKLNNPFIYIGSFDRPNLYFDVLHIKHNDKFNKVLELLTQEENKCGIIYCSTRRDVEDVCYKLINCGYKATRYHGMLSNEEKEINLKDFLFDNVNIMVATNAFGMGIDKANVRFVIHYNLPKDIESYYQEAGRAGRDGSNSKCYLLFSKRDIKILEHFINNTEPNIKNTDITKQNAQEKLDAIIKYCYTKKCYRNYMLDYFGEHRNSKCNNCGICNNVIENNLNYQRTLNTFYYNLTKNSSLNVQYDKTLYSKLYSLRKSIATRNGIPPYAVLSDKVLENLATQKPCSSKEFLAIHGIGENKYMMYGYDFIVTIKEYLAQHR